ncbi:MAG TPA: hypothetical protein VL461_05915 [Dictyobacter sp.]|jgi:Tol biopolymer transport system component|nr:hypothetical protein [Dictyobacter sp.]
MKKTRWQRLILALTLPLLLLSVQSCLGTQTQYQKKAQGTHGAIQVNTTPKAYFKGDIYLTLDNNLYMLDAQKNLHQLTHGLTVEDPAVSPDGKTIAFVNRYTDYSDLDVIPSTGGTPKILLNGQGKYATNSSGYTYSTYHWFEQPSWAANGKSLLLLSDIQKADWSAATLGIDDYLLDLQLFSVPYPKTSINAMKAVAYATYGDGGLRDPSYRPGHPDQAIYTSYSYDLTGTKQVVQINTVNTNAIQQDLNAHPNDPTYHPGTVGDQYDPSVALTPPTPNLINMQPAISPDGNTLLYLRDLSSTETGIYSMPIVNGVTDVSNPNDPAIQKKGISNYNKSQQLLHGTYLSYPTWSPDGAQIIYYAYNNGYFDLWLADLIQDPQTHTYSLKAGSEIQLTNTHGDLNANSAPVWVNAGT